MEKPKSKYIDIDSIKESYSDPKKRKKLFKIGGAVIVLLLVLPKIIPIITSAIQDRFIDEEVEIIEVDGVVASAEAIDDVITSTGTLRANFEIDLSVEESGQIIELHINEGSEVEEGDLLLKINDNDLQADLERVESNIEVMEESASRQRQLFERGGATQEEYDAALMQLNNLRAEKAAIEAQIIRTEVVAPFDGMVGLKYVDVGGYVTPSTRIASLRDLSSVKIDFSIPERFAARIQTGNEVRFTVQGTDSLFTGEVYAIEPGIDPRTRSVNIRAISDNSGGILRSGAFANVEVILESFEEAILIPAVSLIPDMGEYKVLVFEDGVVSERLVETGIRTSDKVQILSGLAPDETVLVNGLLQVRDGMQVQIRSIQDQDEL